MGTQPHRAKATGLIRYASEENILNKTKFKLTARVKGYIAVLVILIGVLIGMLFLRNDVEARVLRLPGQLYERKDNNVISNVYTYKLINKTTDTIKGVSFRIRNQLGIVKLVSNNKTIEVPATGLAEGTLFIEMNQKDLEGDKHKVRVDVYSDEELIETTTVSFLGPRSYN